MRSVVSDLVTQALGHIRKIFGIVCVGLYVLYEYGGRYWGDVGRYWGDIGEIFGTVCVGLYVLYEYGGKC